MSFDVLLAVFLPLVILFLIFRVYPTLAWSDVFFLFSPLSSASRTEAGIFSPQHAFHSFKRYRQLSMHELSRARSAYVALGRMHKRIGYNIGYPAKLNAFENSIESNGQIADDIARLAAVEYDLRELPAHNVSVGSGDLSRVRESLRHFVRDWSNEGAAERKKIFTPILDVLGAVAPGERAGYRVLIPGSGLGRFAWEASQLGFDTTAVEMSSFMNFAFRFLLSPQTTSSLNQHKIYPYAHWFSHQRSNDSLFRAVEFPDALPRPDGSLRLLQDDFLELPKDQKYDYIVTLFFIDTSSNVFATLEHIHTLLNPNGVWINLGPLLWSSGGAAKLEPSLEELLHAAREIGFTFPRDCPETIECEYTSDQNAMMQWIYKAQFWTAKKKWLAESIVR
ncbi:N2227-domain-containing protein [Guyanagaster necrorhizus]|uniref:N2227-domain-containing protein n=1 Tax=Guyanagaster necrorhizus TaxID=856835 RepID=A0A9P8AW98_9AGAR|nr:N2227-domain-containing protein [Guyanagaster necrorhizus MCA 3950]KAG7449946.1 N2227-domain-containing protein [Guyanagaster necrorhizus MCA 3950]